MFNGRRVNVSQYGFIHTAIGDEMSKKFFYKYYKGQLYFDFEYEINKNFPKKLIDIYDGKTVKDSHGNSVKLNTNELKGLTKRLVTNVFFMNMFKNSINNLSISQKQYYKERLPKDFFK